METVPSALNLLRKYLPFVYSVIEISDRKVARIADAYEQRLTTVANVLEESGVFSARTTIYDLLWEALEGNVASITYLDFIDTTVKSILSLLGKRERDQIVKLVLKMIVSFNDYDSQYKNHFAELAVINKILSEPHFVLVQVEKRLPNGKSFDFAVKEGRVENFVEVYNIDFKIERIGSAEDLKKFLECRIVKKLNAKLAGLLEPFPPFIIVPVLWGDILGIEPYSRALDYFKPYKIIGPFMMIAQYRSGTGDLVYDFGSVKNFLQRAKSIHTSSRNFG